MARPTKALIDIAALWHNCDLARTLAPRGKMVAAVKANAYGHGAVEIARALESRVDALGVAGIGEALALRDAGITAPILLLEGCFSAAEVTLASQRDFWLMVESQEQQQAIVSAKLERPVRAWIKVDTGMHRLGVEPSEAKAVFHALTQSDNVQGAVVMATHFAQSDDLQSTYTQQQIRCFQAAVEGLDAPLSLANSAAILGWPSAHADWNRPGYMLYGASPFAAPHVNAEQLQPVMTLQSAVMSVRAVAAGASVGYGSVWTAERDSRVATVAIGYGDGYPRQARNGTPVLVTFRRAPLAGRVSMDMSTVDVTDLPDVCVGDEVELWGKALPVNEVADWAGTIGYELLTRMQERTPRIFIA